MREIKFRAWDDINKKMHDDVIVYHDGVHLWHESWSSKDLGIDKDYPTLMELNTAFDKIRSSIYIMQYTGLNDRTGKEIYEGDIINTTHPPFRGVITYAAPEFYLGGPEDGAWCDFPWEEWERFEIIGNKYENPELLKEI